MSRALASDNQAGVHPAVLEALLAANQGHAPAYGADPWCARARDAFAAALGAPCEVYFTFSGTGSNLFALACVCRSFEAVICSAEAHLYNSECGAVERFVGCKLIPVDSADGRLRVSQLKRWTSWAEDSQAPTPRVISITQATERGLLYSPEEIREIADFAHRHQMVLHMDGARLLNAAAALGVGLAELSSAAGVDVISFGGTKHGLLFGEAVVFLDPALARHAPAIWKQSGQMPSKSRFVAAQFMALLQDDLWRENAVRENALAARLAARLAALPEVRLAWPAQSNAVFATLPPAWISALPPAQRGLVWDTDAGLVRWMMSFDSREDDVEALIAALYRASGRGPGG